MEYEEYTAETYPSFGKKYNSERAIISLTSWRARINTVAKTIYSLIKQCPGFHIVLVLSEEEFPKMMDELPENLKLFVDNELIEIMWVYKNYKAFKKFLFTMDKYKCIPVISADDDCFYTRNYAQELFDTWLKAKNKRCIVKYDYNSEYPDPYLPQGPTTLYFGFSYHIHDIINSLKPFNIKKSEDDLYNRNFFKKWKFATYYVHKRTCKPYVFHDVKAPLHSHLMDRQCFKKAFGR